MRNSSYSLSDEILQLKALQQQRKIALVCKILRQAEAGLLTLRKETASLMRRPSVPATAKISY
jgi:hypothetical protein